jgi:hypothetical protein
MKKFSIIWILVTFNITISCSQGKIDSLQVGSRYQVELQNETILIGIFEAYSSDNLLVFTSDGSKFEIDKKQIKSLKPLDSSQMKEGKFWYQNPHATRYFFGPSAFNLKEEEGYFQSIYGLVNSINYGITDHFTVGLGTELITLFNGPPTAIITPKFGGYKLMDKTYGGFGTLMIVNSEAGLSGIGYGIITRGSLDHNFTIGTGWAFSTREYFQSKPIFTFSGMTRFRKNMAFVSENWLIPVDKYELIFSYGLRFFGEKMSLDLGFFNTPDLARDILVIGIPYIDFVYKF